MAITDRSRRSLLKTLALTAGMAGWPLRRTAGAQPADAPHLDEKDPAARALTYVQDAARAEKLKLPGFIPGSRCDNCLQLQGSAGDAYRPCSIFPGTLVSSAGWCKGWTAEI